jgi:ribosomal protein S8
MILTFNTKEIKENKKRYNKLYNLYQKINSLLTKQERETMFFRDLYDYPKYNIEVYITEIAFKQLKQYGFIHIYNYLEKDLNLNEKITIHFHLNDFVITKWVKDEEIKNYIVLKYRNKRNIKKHIEKVTKETELLKRY